MCCLGNPIEQDHRGIKQRYYPTLGFKVLKTAAGFCRVYDEVRNYFRPRQKMGQEISLGRRRQLFIGRFLKLQDQFCGV
jgi:putative transposase